MEIVNKPINELIPAEYNPRQATEKEYNDLKASLTKFGIVDPIIVNKRNSHIVGGHLRIKVLKDMGITEVPVFFVDLDDEAEKELNIRLNKNTGSWDFDLLANFDKDVLKNWGFNENEFNLNIDKFDDKKENDVRFEGIYQIIINAENEENQKKIYDDLTELGYQCKTSTL